MRSAKGWTLLVLAGLGAASLAASADLPRFVNARVEERSAAGGLETTIRALVQNTIKPAWIGYAVPIVPGNRNLCCSNSSEGWTGEERNCGPCHLEENRASIMDLRNAPRVELEASATLLVLFRATDHRVVKIRSFTDNCTLDARGLQVYWLTEVSPPESVALLEGFVRGADSRQREEDEHLARSALAAIALTDAPAADQAIDRFVATDQPEWLRREATFWLGEARGRHGLEVLQRLVQEDASERVREQAVFALSISKEPGGLAALIDAAHHNPDAGVRGKALFWLGQKAGKKAAQAITETIENDPETWVKKQAVFALSQLPREEGVPLLIQVARANRNPAVRKQAIFWLGQSKDPRALAFFEEILTH